MRVRFHEIFLTQFSIFRRAPCDPFCRTLQNVVIFQNVYYVFLLLVCLKILKCVLVSSGSRVFFFLFFQIFFPTFLFDWKNYFGVELEGQFFTHIFIFLFCKYFSIIEKSVLNSSYEFKFFRLFYFLKICFYLKTCFKLEFLIKIELAFHWSRVFFS